MTNAADPPRPPKHYRRYRAPREDNAALVEPTDLQSLLDSNRRLLSELSLDLNGLRLVDLARDSRQRLVTFARDYAQASCEIHVGQADSLIVSGHQPELFHPGVWFKNHVLDRLAKRTGAVGVHLLIDSDLCRSTSLRVPTGPVSGPRWASVAYDKTIDARPYEERAVADPSLFASFAERVGSHLEGLVADPLLGDLWPDAVTAATAGANLGESLSRARRLVEQRWGSTTLELPFSTLCDTRELQWVMAFILAELPRVHSAYNASLADYRAAHRLRTPAQPLPDLSRDDGWLEAPLWVWMEDDPTRRPLFVRHESEGVTIANRSGGEWRLPTGDGQPLHDGVDALAGLRAQGVKIRPRALMTTLFSRLLLGDLFLHGIGGAKYDQVTDDLCRRWLGFTPPPHATVTATLRLPIDHPRADAAAETDLRVRLRELEFHPERFLSDDAGAAAPFVVKKREAIGRTDADLNRRHRQIVAANDELRRFVGTRREETLAELESVRQHLHASAVLDSREYSFCLFPENDLRLRIDTLLEDD